MTTEDIEERLDKLGVPYARELFMELAEGRVSAATIGELWIEQAELSGRQDRDFAPLAACELWKRRLPDRPSNEMIDGWMQEGYDHQESGDSTEAARIWWKVWETLRARFNREVRTMDAADRLFSGTQSIFNWCQDFKMYMSDALDANPELAAMGKQYCMEWMEQFPDERGHVQVDFRRALSRYQFRLGEMSAGEATLQEINQRWPEEVWGYVALADAYGHLWPGEPAPELDIERAIEYVEQGLAMATESFARDALVERRQELLRRAAE